MNNFVYIFYGPSLIENSMFIVGCFLDKGKASPGLVLCYLYTSVNSGFSFRKLLLSAAAC